jgi:hypothetical protein
MPIIRDFLADFEAGIINKNNLIKLFSKFAPHFLLENFQSDVLDPVLFPPIIQSSKIIFKKLFIRVFNLIFLNEIHRALKSVQFKI